MTIFDNQNSMAVVTAEGIIYKNRRYSCQLALIEQWFSTNSPYNLVRIPVICSIDEDTLLIILDDGDTIPASKLSNTVELTSYELENYFNKLNQLKLEIKSAKIFTKKSKGINK